MSSKIRKAVITAAGRGMGVYPAADTVQRGMLSVVDRDGVAKPVIHVIVEEALAGGVDEVAIVCAPGDEEQYRQRFASLSANRRRLEGPEGAAYAETVDEMVARLRFIVQEEPKGYGNAVFSAKSFTGDEPFLLLLNDHLYLSSEPGRRCSQQIVALASEEGCSVAGVRATRESLIGNYGTLSGRQLQGRTGLYQIDKILEKPSLSVAEVELQTVGLRAAYYLCFFGMHALTPEVFDILSEQAASASRADWQLTPALAELARRQKYLALEVKGNRYDIGHRYGLLQAQLALGIDGPDHDQVLAAIVDTLAEAQLQGRHEGVAS